MTHNEYIKQLATPTVVPCTAGHITFNGKCLNCGYIPGLQVTPLPKEDKVPNVPCPYDYCVAAEDCNIKECKGVNCASYQKPPSVDIIKTIPEMIYQLNDIIEQLTEKADPDLDYILDDVIDAYDVLTLAKHHISENMRKEFEEEDV